MTEHDIDIVYHGGGYAGLTGAVHFAMAGKQVLIYDPDEQVVAAINSGKPKAGEFLRYLTDYGARMASDTGPALFGDQIRATVRFRDAALAPVHIIAAPSERAGRPEMSIVLGILDRIIRNVEVRKPVIIVESTLTPGTIDRFLDLPLEGGRVPARDLLQMGGFCLAVAPRRDWFADPAKNVKTLDRVVGGVMPGCTAAAVNVLSIVSTKIHVTDYRTAELVKPLENALLHVPLMMVHELASNYPYHDVAEAVRLAGTHWRLFPLHLNFGAGGRCVPLGPKYLLDGTQFGSDMLEAAVQQDKLMREQIAVIARSWLTDIRRKDARSTGCALVLGMAYRPDFKDAGSSPGVDIANGLVARGVKTMIHDPMWGADELLTMVPGASVITDPGSCVEADVVLLSTPHQEYFNWPLRGEAWRKGQIVLDAQGYWNKGSFPLAFETQGVEYRQVGKPGWSKPVKGVA